MHSRHICLAIIALAVITGVCPAGGADLPATEIPADEPSVTPQPRGAAEGTSLQPGDILSLDVRGEPQMSGTYYVGPEGTIDLPMVGSVPAAGRTVSMLTSDITSRLDRYLIDPMVRISLLRETVRTVSILGAIRSPGSYDQRSHDTLLSLVAAAGGPTSDADLRRTLLIRGDERALVGTPDPEGGPRTLPRDVPLRPGDTVYIASVAERAARVVGAVSSPGFVVVHDDMSLSRAILAAGGAADGADLRFVQLLRASERLTVDLRPILDPDSVSADAETVDPAVQLDDIIIVPSRQPHSVHVIGAVRAPGAHLMRDADRASKAIALAGGASEDGDVSRAYILREGGRVELDLRELLAPDAAGVEHPGVDAATQPGDVVVVPSFRPVYVLGAVQQPGPVLPERARSVTEALFGAGGLAPDADSSGAYVIRSGEQIRVDLRSILEGLHADADMALAPDDALIVPTEPQIVNVVGAVNAPGAYPIMEAATLADLWGLAGGALDAANTSASVLLRGAESEVVNVRALIEDGAVEHNRTLLPGDTLLVPTIRREVYVFGAVREPGIIAIREGDTIIDVIARAGGPTPAARIGRIALVRRDSASGDLQTTVDRTPERPERVSDDSLREDNWRDRRSEWERARTRVESRERPADRATDDRVTERIDGGDRSLHLFDLAEVRDGHPAYDARPGDVIWVPAADLRRGILDEILRDMLLRAPFYLLF